MERIQFLFLTTCVAFGLVAACSANSNESTFGPGTGGTGGTLNIGGEGGGGTNAGGAPLGDGAPVEEAGDGCAEAAKRIYLVTEERTLYSFNPEVNGLAGYQKINQLGCQSSSTPQSMAVDRSGKAYVFYSSGELFAVDTSNAKCTPLSSYQHPVNCSLQCQLGMGFTADAPGSTGQRLYIQSPDFGLGVVDTSTLKVDKKNVFNNVAAELTGGIDAKLFRFEADTAELVEVTQDSWQTSAIHKFNISDVVAWAFARYAGKFYMFTASSGGLSTDPTKTTVYDPVTNQESTRDPDLGFTVVGAGQSTCVPPPPIK